MGLDYQCSECSRPLGFKGICWMCRSKIQQEKVRNWTDEEKQQKVQTIIANIEQLKEYGSDEFEDASHLLNFHDVCPPELQRAAAKHKVTQLDKIYYHAPADVRDTLIHYLQETENPMEAANYMCCLAMQGDETSLEVLLELQTNPREWRKRLYVDPSVYAQGGGWTFDETGKRQSLIFSECFPLEEESDESQAAIIGRLRSENCPDCHTKMVDLLVLNGRDPRLQFLGIDGIFTATCCPNCVSYSEGVFSRFTLEGGSEPIQNDSQFEDFGYRHRLTKEELQCFIDNSAKLGLSQHSAPIFYGSDSDILNTIGGFAGWVQDPDYIACPDCGKSMRYLAQLHWDTLIEGMEGTLFIEVCTDCHTAAVVHQQT